MTSCNLIPPNRRWRERFVRARRRWAIVVAAYGLGLLAFAGAASSRTGQAHAVGPSLAAVDEEAGQVRRELARARASLASARRQLEIARAVAEHPDFGALLGFLAQSRGDGVVLESANLRGMAGTRSRAEGIEPRPSEYVLMLTGQAREPKDASDYVRMLEETRVFDGVTLTETRSRSFGKARTVGFGVRCTLAEASRKEGGR